MRRTIWPMTRFFSTVRPGRPSVRTRTSPRLKALIGPRWLNKARRVRPALKDRLVRKAPPDRPGTPPTSGHKGSTYAAVRKSHKFKMARLVLRVRLGLMVRLAPAYTLFPYTTLFRSRFFSTVRPGRPSVRTRTSPRLKALIGPRWLNKARRVRPALKDRLVRKAP